MVQNSKIDKSQNTLSYGVMPLLRKIENTSPRLTFVCSFLRSPNRHAHVLHDWAHEHETGNGLSNPPIDTRPNDHSLAKQSNVTKSFLCVSEKLWSEKALPTNRS